MTAPNRAPARIAAPFKPSASTLPNTTGKSGQFPGVLPGNLIRTIMNASGENDLGIAVAVAFSIVGSLVSAWLARKLSRWIPCGFGKRKRGHLLNKYWTTLCVANALSFAGILTGGGFYYHGWLSKYDWRGLAIGMGLACFLPVFYVVLVNVKHGREAVKECLVAYAIDVKSPPDVLIVVMSIMVVAGIVAAASLIFWGR